MAMESQIVSLLPALEAVANAEEQDLELAEETRERLYSVSRKIMLRVEADSETMQRIDFGPIQLAVLRLAYDIKLFETISERNIKDLHELALITGVKADFLSRILKFCAAHGMVAETGLDEYRPTKMTRSFANPGFRGAIISHHATTMRAAQALPSFLAKTCYDSPRDQKNCPLQHGIGCEESFFEYLAKNPLISDSFNDYMAAVQLSQLELGKLYDFDKLWGSNTTDDTPLFVDVGGGNGQQCISLRESTNAKGRIILQDLPDVVQGVELNDIEVTSHDFFNEQPVKGSYVYYFRTILHDWPDEDCRKILKQTYDAMDTHSVVLLDERMIADRDAHWIAMNMDLAMSLLLAAGERSERQWRDLLNSVGLEIHSVNNYSSSGTCLIEAIKQPLN